MNLLFIFELNPFLDGNTKGLSNKAWLIGTHFIKIPWHYLD